MDIYIYDAALNLLGIIQNYKSVIWNEQYFSKNDLQLVTPADFVNTSLLTPGNLLVREKDVSGNEINNVMLINKTEMKFDQENGWLLTAYGSGLKSVLSRRIVWGQMNLSGTVEDSIRRVVNENCIAPTELPYLRAIPNLYLGEKANLEESETIQLFGENIGDWIESVCKLYGYGWDVFIKEKKWTFKLYKGTDRTYSQSTVDPVVFSPEFDNLYSSDYILSYESNYNAALVGGEGEGDTKYTAPVGGSSFLNRREIYIDASNVSSNGEIITPQEYIALLMSYGNEQLAQYQETKKFEGEVDPDGMYKLGEDFFLGDIVQIDNGNGIKATARITEIIYSADENGEKTVPTFSEWEVI